MMSVAPLAILTSLAAPGSGQAPAPTTSVEAPRCAPAVQQADSPAEEARVRGDYAQALALSRADASHARGGWRARALATIEYARALSALDRFAEAGKEADKAYAMLRARGGERDADTISARAARIAISVEAGKVAGVEGQLRSVLADRESRPCDDPELLTRAQLALAAFLPENKSEEARRLAEAALAARRARYGDAHWKTAEALVALSRQLRGPRGYKAAEPLLRDALAATASMAIADARRLSVVNALAGNLAAQQRQTDAIAVIEPALRASREKYGDDSDWAIALAQTLASALIGAGRPDEAEPLLRESFDHAKARLGETHPITTSALMTAAIMRLRQGKLDAAEQNIRTFNDWALQTYGEDHAVTISGKYVLAVILNARGQKPTAAGMYAAAAKAALRLFPKNDPFLADLLPVTAYSVVEQNFTSDGLTFYEAAYEAQKEVLGEDAPQTLLTGCRLAFVRANQRERDRALELLDGLAPVVRKLPAGDITRKECLEDYAGILVASGKTARARDLLMTEFFPHGVRTAEIGSDKVYQAYLLAMTAATDGNTAEFDRLMKEVLPVIGSVTPDHSLQALQIVTSYVNFLARDQRNDEISAIAEGPLWSIYVKAKDVNFLLAFGQVLSVFPTLLPLYADDRATLVSMRQALESGLDQLSMFLPQDPYLHDEILETLMLTTSYLADASATLRISRELFERKQKAFGPTSAQAYAAQWRLGWALLGTGKPSEAEDIFRAVYPHLEQITSTSFERLEYRRMRLAALLQIPGRESDALAAARGIANEVTSWRAAVARDPSPSARFLAAAASDEVVFPALADSAWLVAAASPQQEPALKLEAFNALQRSLGTPATRAVALTAARRAAEHARNGLERVARDRQNLLDEWRANQAKQTQLLLSPPPNLRASLDPLTARQSELERGLKAADRDLERRFPRYFELINPQPVAVAQAQANLAADEAAMLVVTSSKGTHVMVLADGKLHWRLVPLPYEELLALVGKLRSSLESDSLACAEPSSPDTPSAGSACIPFDRQAAWRLYSLLLGPFETVLKGKRQLFVAASGPLATVPFGVLVTAPPSGRDSDPAALRATAWMSDAHALVEIPSLQALALLRASRRPGGGGRASRFAGFGDPLLFGAPASRRAAPPAVPVTADKPANGGTTATAITVRDLPRLPGTAIELDALRVAMHGSRKSVRLREQATERAIRSADLSSVRVLAFATHGLAAWDVDGLKEPALVFTPPAAPSESDDGLLTATEITGMRIGADWVILSACNTGGGQYAGAPVLSGLARAFFYAGARTLLVSHWPVRDDIAAELAADAILRQQRNRHISRAQALAAAMRAIRESPVDPTRAHPAAWAPFALVGDAR